MLPKRSRIVTIGIVLITSIALIWVIVEVISLLNFDLDEFLSSFASDFLATVAGIIIGIPIALWYDRYREENVRKEKVTKILTLLKDELESNKKQLMKWKVINDPRFIHSVIYGALLKDELWRAFSEGGELEWIKDVELLDKLSSAYHSIELARSLMRFHSELPRHNMAYWTNEDQRRLQKMLSQRTGIAIGLIDFAAKDITKRVR